MKLFAFILAIYAIFTVPSGFAFEEMGSARASSGKSSSAEEVPVLSEAEASVVTDRLEDLKQTDTQSRLSHLERLVDELEQENRLQDDKIRSLDRSLNDVRRKL